MIVKENVTRAHSDLESIGYVIKKLPINDHLMPVKSTNARGRGVVAVLDLF